MSGGERVAEDRREAAVKTGTNIICYIAILIVYSTLYIIRYIHPRAESFELHVYYLTYTPLRSSGVPQSVVYPTQASGVISTPF